MIYRFILLSDEVDNFVREISIDSEASFLQFNDAILDSVNYEKGQMTSFFVANEDWEKETEITLIDMGVDSEKDIYVMDSTDIRYFNFEKGQHLIYEFDNINGRIFFIELKEIVFGQNLKEAKCTYSEGNPPVQMEEIDFSLPTASAKGKSEIDDVFGDEFGDTEGFESDEIDEEGFSYGDFSDEM